MAEGSLDCVAYTIFRCSFFLSSAIPCVFPGLNSPWQYLGGEREVIGLRDYGTAYVFRTGIGIRETFVRYFEI